MATGPAPNEPPSMAGTTTSASAASPPPPPHPRTHSRRAARIPPGYSLCGYDGRMKTAFVLALTLGLTATAAAKGKLAKCTFAEPQDKLTNNVPWVFTDDGSMLET